MHIPLLTEIDFVTRQGHVLDFSHYLQTSCVIDVFIKFRLTVGCWRQAGDGLLFSNAIWFWSTLTCRTFQFCIDFSLDYLLSIYILQHSARFLTTLHAHSKCLGKWSLELKYPSIKYDQFAYTVSYFMDGS